MNLNVGGARRADVDAVRVTESEVSDGEVYQQSIMDQWDSHMADFEPEDMLTILIPA